MGCDVGVVILGADFASIPTTLFARGDGHQKQSAAFTRLMGNGRPCLGHRSSLVKTYKETPYARGERYVNSVQRHELNVQLSLPSVRLHAGAAR